MASPRCLSLAPFSYPSQAAAIPTLGLPSLQGGRGLLPPLQLRARRRRSFVVGMAPEEEKMTRRSPLDFPIEWERPKPGRRPDIFPQFSPMKTPLPAPLPEDPPEEDEEEEENKEEEEEDPEKKEPDEPEKQSRMQHIQDWWP
ncbi:hypothetical protein J5N97_027590 [Dioscorea zingiberensis]|uniref:Uncharacterized protein n=1 Tax=Dioscorea zingiberensis TaxID=325984 RepID=A0A9D5H7X6_9LILI|nr:hypothetical protein J5N97_027590 [Dioscorea zingiberensis]